MAYLRQKGNQLALVHGIRDPETKKVEQKTLFTFYSKAEALAALGRSEAAKGFSFRGLVENANPGIRFKWGGIMAQLEEKMEILPDLWDYREARLGRSFREALVTFTRQLHQNDPQYRISSAQTLIASKTELHYLKRLIDWRLSQCDGEETEWNQDTPFFWFQALPMDYLDPEEEEHAERLYLEGRYDEAEALFGLFIECFPRYADGYNRLGDISEERGAFPGAVAMYEKAIEVGRTLFPKRIAKKQYWSLLETRPYMRGLRNLTSIFNRVGRYEEALELCERQESECGDDISAAWFRGEIYLNLGCWQEAFRWTRYTTGLWKERNVLTAFADHELGRPEDAAARYLCGLLNSPRAARMVVRLSPRVEPKTSEECRDHNNGVAWLRSLDAYFNKRSEPTRLFFSRIARHTSTRALETRLAQARKDWRSHDRTTSRSGYDIMQEMESLDFARSQVEKILA